MSQAIFNFDTTYTQLPALFYQTLDLHTAPSPEMVKINLPLMEDLGIENADSKQLLTIFSGQTLDQNSTPIAQAYSGHQFGHFTNLGDGRAALLGEHITKNGTRVDIQLKGSGPTAYSRRGDGKATLKAMLKEYLYSEAIHYLGIPSSRSLAVFTTGEKVFRQGFEQGATLCRVMSSHIRVGTFQYARAYGKTGDLLQLLDYSIQRHFPEIAKEENQAIAFVEKVMQLQIELIVNWLRVGFIHGVMNTDNTSIIGETFDYGPCAFMSVFNPDTVFSSIDRDGRYAYANQVAILKWNLTRLTESLLALIDEDHDKAIEMANKTLSKFDDLFNETWYKMMGKKLGFNTIDQSVEKLIEEFLFLLQKHKKDYHHSFTYLSHPELFENTPFQFEEELKIWQKKWEESILKKGDFNDAKAIMKTYNPIFIPKNYFVEDSLERAIKGDYTNFNQLLDFIKNPYEFQGDMQKYMFAPDDFDLSFQTFCGT